MIVLRAKDDADAIRLANDSDYGLTSAVFSRDMVRALKVAQQIDAGMCHINGATVRDEAQMPFGGVKKVAMAALVAAQVLQSLRICDG